MDAAPHTNPPFDAFVGIHVSKKTLDVCILPQRKRATLNYDQKGLLRESLAAAMSTEAELPKKALPSRAWERVKCKVQNEELRIPNSCPSPILDGLRNWLIRKWTGGELSARLEF